MPAYNLNLKAGTDPSAESLPATLEDFLTKIREYTEVAPDSSDPGGDTVRQILVQSATPTGASANDLWIKLDVVTSRPIGLFAYQGSEWKTTSLANEGTTAERPVTGITGELYFDSDIKVMLMWDGSGWVTQSGSPGDIKFVYAASEAIALTNNPGWSIYAAAKGKSLVGVDSSDPDTDYHDAGNTFGSQTHTLVEGELPVITPNFNYNKTVINGGSSTAIAEVGFGSDGTLRTLNGNSFGSGAAHENRPPSITAFCLKKD